MLLDQATSDGLELQWENSGWTIYDSIMAEFLALLQKLTGIISQGFLKKFSLIHKVWTTLFFL